ncbi:MAG: O-acetyl-ADP-ribose deacetylase [Actinomycetota bacterium]
MPAVPTRLSVVLADITTLGVDAIVNAANSSLMGGGGVDGAIHAAGGPAILAACRTIVAANGPCEPGHAVATEAGELPAGLVFHTVGPVWTADAAADHDRTLASCYARCLDLAREHHCRTIAFPNISTGVYGFPKARAATVAVEATVDWLERVDDHRLGNVVFCCFGTDDLALYQQLLER